MAEIKNSTNSKTNTNTFETKCMSLFLTFIFWPILLFYDDTMIKHCLFFSVSMFASSILLLFASFNHWHLIIVEQRFMLCAHVNIS